MLSKIYLSRKPLLLCFLFAISLYSKAQTLASSPGKIVNYSVNQFNTTVSRATKTNDLVSNMSIEFPTQNGNLATFVFDETLIAEQKIANIQTFDAVSGDGKTRLKLTVFGNRLEGIMHTTEGYFFIEPFEKGSDKHIIYALSETDVSKMKCDVDDKFEFKTAKGNKINSISPFPVGSTLRTYRIAAAATGEFVNFYTNQATALSKIVSVLNAANLIYELEASIRFQLVTASTNYSILFTNAATDPFTPNSSFASADASQAGFVTMAGNGTLPYSSYDIGHTFSVWDPGNSSIGSRGQAGPNPCIDTQKARGWTEWTTPAIMPTYLSMVVGVFVHEVGHQFTAWHTYNAVGGTGLQANGSYNSTFCLNGWSDTDAIEPGGGTTLMSYADNCIYPTNYTISGNNDLGYFNTKSLEKIYNYVTTSATCFTTSATGNTPPVANAGADITIPKGTPFTLNGSATDANGDAMSYTWDQYDVATIYDKGALGSSINGLGGFSAVNSTTAPLFRSEQSSTSTSRTFPKLQYILADANNPADNEGEDLPQVARSMNFRFTVRDNRANGGGVDSDGTIVNVVDSGPFEITSQNASTLWFYNGTNTANITWNVNGTNAAPLNTSNVKISFSTDGGQNFPIVLIASTPNDGSHTITIPNNLTSQGRIKVEAIGNVYFDLNNVNITITTSCSPETSNIYPSLSLSAQAGNSSLNLGLGTTGSTISSFSGTIASSDPATTISFDGGSGSCQSAGNSTYYDIFTFIPSISGSYTFSFSGSAASKLINIYNGAYSNSSTCANWLGSSGIFISPYVYTNQTVTVTLTAFTTYKMVVSGFSGVPASPNYTITPTTVPSGAFLYNPLILNPFAYTFLTKNNTSGNIIGFSNTSDLSNSSIYTAGSYTVYGLSYQGGLDLTPYIGTSFSAFQTLLTNSTVCGTLSTNSKTVTITPCSQPSPPITTSGSRCGPGTVNLSASNCAGTYNWYDVSSGGISLNSTANFTTPSLSITTTYYVDCIVSGCASNRTSVIATINNIPFAPNGVPGERCGTGIVSLSATSCAGTYNWYLASTGGASQGSLAAFTTPSISTTTTYYVDCTVGGCTNATRTAVIATVNNIPSTPSISGGGSCLNSPVTLTASGCSGTYKWYNVAVGGSVINTGASFPNITTQGTYYVDCTVGTCVGSRASTTITLKPSAPTVAGVTISSGQTATLNATNCSGTVNWYASTLGNAPVLGSGPSYTTSPLTINTTYYADCVVGLCTSNTRTPGVVTVTNCSSSLVLASTADDISTGDILKQASATASIPAPNANIMATNKITGTGTKATYQAKSILLNPGFSASTGTIFKAEPGGCN